MTPADRPAGVGLSADRRVVEAGVVAIMAVWAANFVVVKGAIELVPPVAFTFVRYALASAALLVLLRWSEGAVRLPRPDSWRMLVLGGLGFGVYQILWTVGLQTIPAGDSALLIAATPVFTAVIAVLIGTDTLPPRKAIGVALSFLGVVLVVAAGVGIELTGSPVGFALTLLAALCWATYTAFGARFLRRHSPLVLTTWATIGGTLVLATIGVPQLLAPGAISAAASEDVVPLVLAVAYSGILAAAIANIVVFHGVQMLGPTRVTTIQALVPAMAVVFAFLFLGEPIHLGQVIGGAIIVGGVALTRIPMRRAVHSGGSGMTDPSPAGIGPAPPVPVLVPGQPPLAILVDYDGTIALTDVSDTVMAEWVTGAWEEETVAYDSGLMGSRRLMTREIGMLDADPADLFATAAAQPHDAGFRPFVERARAAGIPVEIVSDGFGFFIEPAMAALGVPDLPIVTARTTFAGRRATIAYPNGNPHCLVCGTCKRDRVLAHRAAGRRVVFIGDGESDRYAAGYSDIVFAKRSLVRICLEAGWPFERWTEFAEIDAWLAVTLATWTADPSSMEPLAPRTPPPNGYFCGEQAWGEGLVDPPAGYWPPR